jgi:hypothetical protein
MTENRRRGLADPAAALHGTLVPATGRFGEALGALSWKRSCAVASNSVRAICY